MMKKIILVLTICLSVYSSDLFAQQGVCDGDDITITSGVSTGSETQHASNTLVTQSGTSVVISSGATATYKAGTNITLNPGFKVETGAQFSASIETCERPFITEWDINTTNPITIPTVSGETYDYTVDWGDNSLPTNHTGSASHTYNANDTYKIRISGNFPRIDFRNGKANKENQRIKKIIQWGDIEWTSMNGAFYECIFLNIDSLIVDKPDLSLVTDMTDMFFNANELDYNMGSWDVSTIAKMKGMLDNTGISRDNYEKILIGWSQVSGLQQNVALGVAGLEYCSPQSVTARAILTDIATLNWGISGDINPCARGSVNQQIKIKKVEENNEFSIYPNPAKDRIYISGIDVKKSKVSIQVLDVSGRVVLKKENQTEIDISRLKSGVYFVKVLGEIQKTIKLIKE